MKHAVGLILLGVAALVGHARTEEELKALRNGAEAKVVLRVVGDRGDIVANAMVTGSFHMNDGKGKPFSGNTDTNGIYVATGKSVGDWHYFVLKDGYYRTHESLWLSRRGTNTVADGRWQPYGTTNTVVLKRTVNPVAMCVKSKTDGILPPVKNEYIGFDLEKGDWVRPHGKGTVADFNLKYEYEAGTIPLLYYRGAAFFAFTNKYDGVYVMKKETFSAFNSVYQADTNAVYQQEVSFVYDRLSGEIKENSKLPDTDYLVLRIRSKVGEDGHLISAHYAKIYGPVAAGGGGVYFGFYFNPNANDPNLEADTTKNLLNPSDLGFAP
jgi:hypothetical protein